MQVLLNKVALSSFDFGSPNALLFYQCALCVLLVHACKLAGLVKVEPFNWQIIKVGAAPVAAGARRRCALAWHLCAHYGSASRLHAMLTAPPNRPSTRPAGVALCCRSGCL